MSSVWHQVALHFFNYTSILCLKPDLSSNQTFKVSRWMTLANLLKMPFVLVFSLLVSFIEPIKNEVFHPTFIRLKDYTIFAQFALFFVMFLINNSMLLLCLLQVMKREEINDFVNRTLKHPLKEKYLKKFKKICLKNLALSLSVFGLNLILSFYGLMKLTFSSLIASFVIFYPSFVNMGFITYVQTFESFTVALMKEFKNSLKCKSKHSYCSQDLTVDEFLQLSRKFQKILDLVDQFNEAFGKQMTIVVSFFALLMVFNVKNLFLLSRIVIKDFSFSCSA